MCICRNLDVVTSHFLPFHWGGRVILPLLWSADFFFFVVMRYFAKYCVSLLPPSPRPSSANPLVGIVGSWEVGNWRWTRNEKRKGSEGYEQVLKNQKTQPGTGDLDPTSSRMKDVSTHTQRRYGHVWDLPVNCQANLDVSGCLIELGSKLCSTTWWTWD